MGLDIYMYLCKSRQAYEKYANAKASKNSFEHFCYENKYKEESDRRLANYKKWSNECSELIDNGKLDGYPKLPDDCLCDLTLFCSAEDLSKYHNLEAEEERCQMDAWYKELDQLYMRKVYWFSQFVYSKNPDRMHNSDERFDVKLIDDCIGFLSKADVAELIEKMKILRDTPTLEKCNEVFPMNPDYTFGTAVFYEYDYSAEYLSRMISEYTAVYEKMADENILVYDESW